MVNEYIKESEVEEELFFFFLRESRRGTYPIHFGEYLPYLIAIFFIKSNMRPLKFKDHTRMSFF
jgi:hypothetical protein